LNIIMIFVFLLCICAVHEEKVHTKNPSQKYIEKIKTTY